MKKLQMEFELQGGSPKAVVIDQSPFMIGSLLSSQLVLTGEGVAPLHALIEFNSDAWMITDLGSESGVKVNSKKIEIESGIDVGDEIQIGSTKIKIRQVSSLPADGANGGKDLNLHSPPPSTSSVRSQSSEGSRVAKKPVDDQPEEVLFNVSGEKSAGNILEVVSYWSNVVLEVEHFHPSKEWFKNVTIGDPTKANFLSAGSEELVSHTLAEPGAKGYTLNLLPSMKGTMRKDGKMTKVGGGAYSLGLKDLCHIEHGPIRFFFMFVRPPVVHLPKEKNSDPLFSMLMTVFGVLYLLGMIVVFTSDYKEPEKEVDDLWNVVYVPEKKKEVKKEKLLAEVKKPPKPPKAPPPAPPEPVKPVKPKEAKKPPPKPKKAPPAKMAQNLTQAKTQPKQAEPPKKVTKRPLGSQGAGKGQKGGVRKGNRKQNLKGVAGGKKGKSSGVNLSKLGLGVGKISSKKGAGAIYTNFKSSAGGAGGGSGTGAKTLGLGGVGSSVASVGLAGSGAAVNKFGSGKAGFVDGKSVGSSFKGTRGKSKINVTPGDPLVSGGLTQEEILAVIRSNLSQIRHCYERLLQRSPSSAGKIKVRFVVNRTGRVNSASTTQSDIGDGKMKSCLLGLIRTWNFPKPRGGEQVTVNYPFTFNPL